MKYSIIAVTGLAGHPFGSWRHRVTHAMWLQDFLPKESGCEGARILTYGYNTKLVGKGTVDDTFMDYRRDFVQQLENARRSEEVTDRGLWTLNLMHANVNHRRSVGQSCSLGIALGELSYYKQVKLHRGVSYLTANKNYYQALVEAKNQPRHHKDILDSTKAILFFGTPHAGLEIDQLVEMVNDMAEVGEPSSRLKLLYHLSRGSEFLLGLRDELTEIWDKLNISSFYENRKTPTVQKDVRCTLAVVNTVPGPWRTDVLQSVTGVWRRDGPEVKMVEVFSALLHLPRERRIPISRNHTEMVKFSSAADQDYQTVITHVSREIARLHGM